MSQKTNKLKSRIRVLENEIKKLKQTLKEQEELTKAAKKAENVIRDRLREVDATRISVGLYYPMGDVYQITIRFAPDMIMYAFQRENKFNLSEHIRDFSRQITSQIYGEMMRVITNEKKVSPY